MAVSVVTLRKISKYLQWRIYHLSLIMASNNYGRKCKVIAQSHFSKSFFICTVYRPPSTPLNFIDDLAENIMESLLLGLDVIILGDLNHNSLRDNIDSCILVDFCSTFKLTQLIKQLELQRIVNP